MVNLIKSRSFGLLSLTVVMLILSACGEDSEGAPKIFEYDCSVFPDQLTSPYILPYEIGSGFLALPHAARTDPNSQNLAEIGQFYAIDIVMPIGTPLVASRAGVVVRTEERFTDTDRQAGHENFIIIEHDDKTYSRYFHLTENGAFVDVNEVVTQYQQIGLSGNTGNSTGPHLHLDVVGATCDRNGDINTDLRNCTSIPVTFRNTVPLDCGLEFEESYPAFGF